MVVGECKQCSATLFQGGEAEDAGGAVVCRDGLLQGTYGSEHDAAIYASLEGEIPEGATFCDACINEMIAAGRLREVDPAELMK